MGPPTVSAATLAPTSGRRSCSEIRVAAPECFRCSHRARSPSPSAGLSKGLRARPVSVVDARAGTLDAVADDPDVADELLPNALGPNAWLVDEMHEQYLADPTSVSESWQDFFADYRRDAAPQALAAAAARPPAPRRQRRTPAAAGGARAPPAAAPAAPTEPPRRAEPGEPIRGAAARIVANMEASLEVPTATSFRSVPAKLLEVNRRIINGYLGRTRGGKVSFTHLIGYAVVRAIHDTVPVMNSSYVEDADGKPRVVRHEHVSLGIAVDMEKSDGSRTLLVPVVRDADDARLPRLLGRLRGADPQGPVEQAQPRRLRRHHGQPHEPGHDRHPAVGAAPHARPGPHRRRRAASTTPRSGRPPIPSRSPTSAISKVITISSTYDHRIIQGAESGLFLKRVEELLLGADGFYDEVFRALGVPYEAVQWRRDVNPIDREQAMLEKQMAVANLIRVHRVRGHLIADLDPLRWKEPDMPVELDPATYGLTIWDLDREFLTGGLGGQERMALGDILHVLRDAYCRTIGIEYMHIQDPEEQRWIQEQVEGVSPELDLDDQRYILERLNAAEAFEKFLATKYVGQKRFGLEGAESAIPILDAILEAAADADLDGSVIGMPHRGRLNVLTNIVGKSYDQLFKEFEGQVDPDSMQGSGDVKYHLGQIGKFVARSGKDITVELAANPSHLEAVDPVVVGMVRAKQDAINDPEAFSVLPILMHGDAAFAGQGVVAETLNMSDIKGYRVGGTIHVVVNNQIGFTTTPESARSGFYSTDVAKIIQAPIFHVNGDDPEACVRVARLAFAYRQRFHKDVVIDMVCYRRHGHNEGDDPSYTQPMMYAKIDARRSVRKLFTESLVKRGQLSLEEAEGALDDFQKRLQTALDETRQSAPASEADRQGPAAAGRRAAPRRDRRGSRRPRSHLHHAVHPP